MFLSKTHLSLLGSGSTQEDSSRHNRKIVEWDVKNQIKQIQTSRMKLGTFLKIILDSINRSHVTEALNMEND